LDSFTGGFHPGELIVVSGHNDQIQNRFLEGLALNVACEQQIPVAYFSFKRDRWSLAEDLLVHMTQVHRANFAHGPLGKEDAGKVKKALKAFQDSPLYINDSNEFTAHEISQNLELYLDKPGLIIVDCLQLVQGWGEAIDRKEEIDLILCELKNIARTRNAPIVLGSLLYPYCRSSLNCKPNNPPIMADFMNAPETARVAAHADTVLFFHREPLHLSGGGPWSDCNNVEVIIEKRLDCGALGSPRGGRLNLLYGGNPGRFYDD
jgi:replicative DNA helicase